MLDSKMLEQLIRDSERLAIARAYVTDTKYPDKELLLSILGTAEKVTENETV